MPFEQQELAKFGRAGKAISDAVGASFETWANEEAAIILKQWAGHVPEALPDRVTLRARGRARKKGKLDSLTAYRTTINTGRFGGEIGLLWFKSRRGKWLKAGSVSDSGAVAQPRRRFTDKDWGLVQAAQAAASELVPHYIKGGLRAIGLARQSVIQIADSLGIALESVKGGGGITEDFTRARAATDSEGKRYTNGFGYRAGKGDKFSITLVNEYPYAQEAQIDQALQQVVAQRMAYHEVNLASVVKKDLRAIEAAYPYLKATT